MELVSIDGLELESATHPAGGHGTRGAVIQVHGINADMTEGGMFVRLAEALSGADFNVLRFSFRGHGGSAGTERGVTIAGELLDLQAAAEHASERFPGQLSVVAASFGAVSASLSLPWLGERLDRLVLWNPVLDLHRTFVEPELPWGRHNFGPEQQELLATEGFLMLDDEFEVGRVMFEEFRHYKPLDCLLKSAGPTLVVHGDRDASVSYEIARNAASHLPNATFLTIKGSDHGFDTREREDEAIAATVDWLTTDHRGPV